jgi:hypothetical protein
MLATRRQTQNMTKSKPTRGRSNASDRGGIRKRGAPPTRMDRDGDLAMGGGSDRGRGGNHGRGQARDTRKLVVDNHRTLNTIQKAIAGDANSQVNIRRGSPKGGPSQEISITGWKSSKAATNADGGISSLLGFLERKLNPSNTKTSSKHNGLITKVCATSALHERRRSIFAASYFTKCLSRFRKDLRSDCRLFSSLVNFSPG